LLRALFRPRVSLSKRTWIGIGKPDPFPARGSSDRPQGRPAASNGEIAPSAWRVLGSSTEQRLSVGTVRLIKRSGAMPIIKADSGLVTQINVFTVPEGGQQALIDLLSEAARFASDTPGWVSASLHRSQDGTRVVNYAQSEDLAAAQAVIARLRNGGWFARNKAKGESHPGLYDVVFTLER
jgi:heme-degrading monooxygenase HmoA